MFCTRAMTYLAAGVFEVWGLLKADKAPGLSITCSMTRITLLDLFWSKVPHLSFNTLKRDALLSIGHEILIFLRMALFAGQ
jgi:hypothetical protein